jgi:hypothetical protein
MMSIACERGEIPEGAIEQIVVRGRRPGDCPRDGGIGEELYSHRFYFSGSGRTEGPTGQPSSGSRFGDSKPLGDEAGHGESGRAIRLHGEITLGFLTTISTSRRPCNERRVTFL